MSILSAEARVLTILDVANRSLLAAVRDRDMAKLFKARDEIDRVCRAWANHVKAEETFNKALTGE